MGGISTSHSAVLSSQRATASSTFDLHSWQGLTKVLKVGKESLTDPRDYAEFRNLVLQYAQQGGDAELRKKIDAILTSFQDTPLSPYVPKPQPQRTTHTPLPVPETSSKTSFAGGRRRMQPQFNAPNASGTNEPKNVVEKNLENTRMAQEVPIPRPQATTEERPSTPVPESAPILEEGKGHELRQQTVSASREEVTSVVPEPVKVASSVTSLAEYKIRITEIKRAVNNHIGNPASLIEVHNVLGKKYMTALLSALKATGGNGTEGVENVMARLEEAYSALVAHATEKNDTPVTQKDEVDITPVQEIVAREIIVPDTTTEIPARIEIVPEEKHDAEVRQERDVNIDAVKNSHRTHSAGNIPPPLLPHTENRTPEKVRTKEIKLQKQPHIADKRDAPISSNNQIQKHSASHTLASLLRREKDFPQHSRVVPSQVPQMNTPKGNSASRPIDDVVPRTDNKYSESMHTSKSAEVVHHDTIKKSPIDVDLSKIVATQSELSSPENTRALNHLLHEWNIFSGSGLFGMGPGGFEHPLYQTLAPLSMGEVIAGRWEDSSPKITKIIKEYVDAWRHEQGTAYTINETFEHYLRRVVQRILKRQT